MSACAFVAGSANLKRGGRFTLCFRAGGAEGARNSSDAGREGVEEDREPFSDLSAVYRLFTSSPSSTIRILIKGVLKMDVREVEKLAEWYLDHFAPLSERYQELIAPVQNNANQQAKSALEGELNALLSYLTAMDFEVLSLQQIKLLDELGVGSLLGHSGAEFVAGIIRTSNYDPATALKELTDAHAQLNGIRLHFDTLLKSMAGLKLRRQDTEDVEEFITIRVGFQNDAAINNVTEWKDSAKDWYDIIRGLALASNEAPEATRVIGASTGSIILILAGTATVTALLALISKNVAAVAKDTLEILHSVEDLRQRKLLTKVMEAEFKSLIDTRKQSALDNITKEVKPLLADANGEKIPALTNSIKKLLAFNEKGGNVDFVAPDDDGSDTAESESEENEEVVRAKAKSGLSIARDAIRQYQEVREQLKLLSHHRSSGDED